MKERCYYYGQKGSDPGAHMVSDLSPYIHFGQISPVYIAREVIRCNKAGKDAFLEELIVRRELSINYVYYNDFYAGYEALPAWARETLSAHKGDKRPYLYDLQSLERAETHDPYWNAAQAEMVRRGKMHGYMRMYWGKKILEWSPSPREAFSRALYLNNKYELDGRDPNGFAGVAWCFGKHDRAWPERPVFGKVRYMNAAGLERKFNMAAYVKSIAHQ
jgi:deoxyribodipyrimidine photo-lyase